MTGATDDFYERPIGWAMVTLGWLTVTLGAVAQGMVAWGALAGLLAMNCCRRWALARRAGL